MAEPPNLVLKARDILASPSHEELETLLNQLSTHQETTEEHQTATALFNFLAAKFANCLTLMLLQVYRSSSNDDRRFQSINLLSETLAECRKRNFELHLVALYEVKPLLISCLKMKVPEIRIFRRIVSFIAYDVVTRDNNGWDELSDCILELTHTEPITAFHVFIDLPPLYERFINRFAREILEKAEKVLRSPEQSGVEDWSLGLETLVKMAIQHLDSEMRLDTIKYLLNHLVKSVSNLVEKGMEEFLLQVLEHLERFLSRDMKIYNYNKMQCNFVSTFLFKIKDLGTHTKEATSKIHLLVKSFDSPSIQQQQQVMEKPQDHLNTLSPLKILRIFASTDVEERSRELAIRKLNLLLSHHRTREEIIDISEMRELQPLLINCLWRKEGISESMFKVLGEVVYHVACEMMNVHDEIWYDLQHYIASNSKTEFQRAVYIFQCLTMWLEDDFVVPIIESLLPEICSRLNSPRELSIDNSCWVLAFVGAFCTAVHLVAVENYAGYVKEVADQMIGSVRELVERGMEVGLVRRAFIDLESIVKKQEDWFNKNEYKFIKDLLRRLYEIKGMKMESRMVLWRINVYVKRGITELPYKEMD